MKGTARLILMGGLWAASLVASFLAGGHFLRPAGTGGAYPEPPDPGPAGHRPASSLGRETASPTPRAENRADPAGGSLAGAADVRQRVAAALRELGPGRSAVFNQSALFRAMEPFMDLPLEEIPAALAEIEATVESEQARSVFQALVMGRWAEQDPAAAVLAAEKMAGDGDPTHARAIHAVIGTWAQRAPEAAWQWYAGKRATDDFPDGISGVREFAQTVFAGLAAKNLDLSLSRMQQIDDTGERGLAVAGIASATSDPEAWKRILEATGGFDETSRRSSRTMMLSQWAGANPAAAMDLLRTLPAGEVDKVIDSVGSRLVWVDPEQGAAFLIETATEENLSRRYGIVVGSWAGRNPNAAGEWLNRQPPGPALDQARSSFARTAVRRDPESAMAWAGTITDETKRWDTVRDVVTQWSKQDAVAADTALAGSGMPPERIQGIRETIAKTAR